MKCFSWLISLFYLSASIAYAQYDVTLKLPRENFVALEPITASITLTNRTGSEVVLGGPGRDSWLTFELTKSNGQTLTQLPVESGKILQLAPGSTIQQNISFTEAYAPENMGNYAVTARVRHAATGEYYISNRCRFSIVEIKPIWERSYGVPPGFKDVGRARTYGMILFHDYDSTSLYYRIVDEKTGMKLITRRLGPYCAVHDPQFALDKDNQLQVVFMAQPHLFIHAVILPDGKLKKLAYYNDENEAGKPTLKQNGKGGLTIEGGNYFNPNAPRPKPKKRAGKSVGDRPPGV
jgi:hypothetical protein